jgi:glycosyltransferase involved in cell wall biosynthesis
MPLAAVTAIIPAYNEAANIGATIRSIQSQTYHVTQIIVVDDCSTDGTGDIARELGQSVQPGRYENWRQVLPLGLMAAAIILVLWGEVWAIGSYVGRMPKFSDVMSAPTSGALGTVLALTPVVSLAVLVCALHIARLLVPREGA